MISNMLPPRDADYSTRVLNNCGVFLRIENTQGAQVSYETHSSLHASKRSLVVDGRSPRQVRNYVGGLHRQNLSHSPFPRNRASKPTKDVSCRYRPERHSLVSNSLSGGFTARQQGSIQQVASTLPGKGVHRMGVRYSCIGKCGRIHAIGMWLAAATMVLAFFPFRACAETIPVQYPEGASRGFLVLRNLTGKALASGEESQIVKGGRVITRLIFRFKDGSIDDETTVYTQRTDFRLISDHHIQRGPSYPHPLDMTIDAVTGTVIMRSKDGDKQKVETTHMDLPPDLSNGLILTVVKNLRSGREKTEVSMVAPGSKPRVVKLAISPEGEERCFIAGSAFRTRRYLVKVELGGLTKVAAAVMDKTPTDAHVWSMEGEPPTTLRTETQLFENGPIWRIESAAPTWREPNQSGQKASLHKPTLGSP